MILCKKLIAHFSDLGMWHSLSSQRNVQELALLATGVDIVGIWALQSHYEEILKILSPFAMERSYELDDLLTTSSAFLLLVMGILANCILGVLAIGIYHAWSYGRFCKVYKNEKQMGKLLEDATQLVSMGLYSTIKVSVSGHILHLPSFVCGVLREMERCSDNIDWVRRQLQSYRTTHWGAVGVKRSIGVALPVAVLFVGSAACAEQFFKVSEPNILVLAIVPIVAIYLALLVYVPLSTEYRYAEELVLQCRLFPFSWCSVNSVGSKLNLELSSGGLRLVCDSTRLTIYQWQVSIPLAILALQLEHSCHHAASK